MSHKILVVVLVAIAAYLVLPTNISSQPYTYGGVKSCACHNPEAKGKVIDFWKGTKHAHAYKALQSDKAKEISKGKAATDNDSCLKCHVGDKALVGSAFKEDGVQCETCHGAGSGYKALTAMKNHDEAVKKGLVVHTDIEKFCKTCHNQEGHPKPEFKFAEMWKSIKHGPKKS
jgi:hypothetical protein